MHQVRRPKVQGPDVKLALFLFVAFGIGFPIVYLRWRYPVILFVCCTHKSSIFVLFDKIQCMRDSSHRLIITFYTLISIPFLFLLLYTGLLWYINLEHCLDGFMFIVLSVHP